MHAWFVLSVWLHIIAAAVWFGGAVFLAAVAVPAARSAVFQDRGLVFVHRAARRFLVIGWGCLGLLIITGLFNLFFHIGADRCALARADFWTSSYGKVLAGKLMLVGGILILSALHDFVLGPQAAKAFEGAPDSVKAKRWRRIARWIGRMNLCLGLLAIGCGVMLVRGRPW